MCIRDRSITISEKASISPESDTAQDFTNPVTYTVTAEDGTAQGYDVTVEVQTPQVTKYAVTYDLTNITAKNQPTEVESGKALEVTLAAGSILRWRMVALLWMWQTAR